MVHYAEIIDPNAVTPDVLAPQIDELFKLQRTIFVDFERAKFERYVVFSPADYTRIQVVRNEVGAAVGYAAIHAFLCELAGEPLVVVRCESAMLPAYRGRGTFTRFFALQAAMLLWRYRHRKMYGFACATYPATYRMISRYVPEIYPHWQKPTPKSLQELMARLADKFELEASESGSRWVRHVGWRTRTSAAEQVVHDRPRDAATQFYFEQNPDFRDGTGMMMLVPFGARMWLACLGKVPGVLLGKRLRNANARRKHGAPA